MPRLIDADLIQYEPMLSAKGNGMYEEVSVAYKSQIDDLPTIEERKTVSDEEWTKARGGWTNQPERKNIVEIPETGIGDLSDGYHTFNGLYEQRMILFAALAKAYKEKAWKSYRHEDGEYCFGGGWFIVGIDTPEGSYTYHYENKYWDMFDCVDLPRAKHWDGHTEADAETRLMSLEPERKKGRWEENSPVTMRCDQCGYVIRDWFWHQFRYCPNCGSYNGGD